MRRTPFFLIAVAGLYCLAASPSVQGDDWRPRLRSAPSVLKQTGTDSGSPFREATFQDADPPADAPPADLPADDSADSGTARVQNGAIVPQEGSYGFFGDYNQCCEPVCDTCCDPCCAAFWSHKTGVRLSWLYLSARDADVLYATPVNGFGGAAVPINRSAVVDPEFESGWEIDAVFAIDCTQSIVASFTNWESNRTDQMSLPGGAGFLRAELTHPNTVNVAADSLLARADYDISFEFIDLAYKGLLYGDCKYALDVLVGVRYAHLDQNFKGQYQIIGDTTVTSDIDFEGFGSRLGLEGKRHIGYGFHAYADGFVNLLVGEFDSEYRQTNTMIGQQALTGFTDDRFVSIWELEVGLGWKNSCGNIGVNVGYQYSTWVNVINTPDYIQAVQTNNFNIDDGNLTFSGLVTRLELMF